MFDAWRALFTGAPSFSFAIALEIDIQRGVIPRMKPRPIVLSWMLLVTQPSLGIKPRHREPW